MGGCQQFLLAILACSARLDGMCQISTSGVRGWMARIYWVELRVELRV